MCKDNRVCVSIAGCDYNRTVRKFNHNNLHPLKGPHLSKTSMKWFTGTVVSHGFANII